MHWIEERAVRRGTEVGIPWAVCPHPHLPHYNGYVQLPADHGFVTRHDVDEQVQVHGGLTYGIDPEGWIGFDTAHLGDIWPGSYDLDYPGVAQEMWTIDRVEAETRRLARQVATLGQSATGLPEGC